MEKIRNAFVSIIINVLKVMFVILICGTIVFELVVLRNFNIVTLIIIISYTLIILSLYKIIKAKKLSNSYKVIILLSIGAILRGIWMMNVKTLPYSDFETLYNSAIELINNDNTVFTGVNYIARFPHLSYMIVYMAIIMKIFGGGLLTIKIGNFIFSIISMYLIYKVTLEIFNKKEVALNALALSVIFTPMITYVGVLATENIAIPFYLGSVYYFIKATKKDLSIRYLVVSAILLGIGNLFRMVAIIMVIAYCMYILIFIKDKFIIKIRSKIIIISMFVLTLLLGSSLLKVIGITEVNLWSGREPSVTNILKGTNIESFGRFNEEDAAIPHKYNYDYDKVKEESLKIIKERLTTTPPIKLAVFYSGKFVGQWVQGDMSGISWSESGAEEIGVINSKNFKVVSQLIYIVIIILAFIGLFNKRQINMENPIINLFYIILCGYGSFYLISEMQGRYAYIVCWIFIILAISGIEKIKYAKE